MKKQQIDVLAFHHAAGILISTIPKVPDTKNQVLRVRLIQEELGELDNAFASNNIVEVADAIADLLYVVLGTAVSCGIEIEPVFREVHRSNMTKFIDGHLDEGGKWVKGPSYEAANIRPILEQQTGTHDF